jgi:rhodanese-related sulfurtransferase
LHKVWEQQTPDNLIIDNRTEEEYVAGHIPHSVNIPFGTELQQIEEMKRFKHVYFYCHSGRRAQVALINLTNEGLNNVLCVSRSGLPEWISLDYPVEIT